VIVGGVRRGCEYTVVESQEGAVAGTTPLAQEISGPGDADMLGGRVPIAMQFEYLVPGKYVRGKSGACFVSPGWMSGWIWNAPGKSIGG
jgi:hypothetical protein